MTEDKTSLSDAVASAVIILITLVAGILIGFFWCQTWHQAGDLKKTAAAATETTHQTITNAAVGQAEEGKLIAHAKDTQAAVDAAKRRIDHLPKPVAPTCVPDLTGKGYVIINAPDPDEYWRAFADGYNSVLDRAEAGSEGAAVHPVDGAGVLPAAAPEP
ncbi:MAG: hypothetical protein NVV72_00990 [Asticcacaulis sp.]|nr:hypothetical protein [Asticcacaulis sp.]